MVKKRYLENGNKYFAKGKYKEASIMYRNALQKDMRYGEAHYRFALAELRLGPYAAGRRLAAPRDGAYPGRRRQPLGRRRQAG